MVEVHFELDLHYNQQSVSLSDYHVLTVVLQQLPKLQGLLRALIT